MALHAMYMHVCCICLCMCTYAGGGVGTTLLCGGVQVQQIGGRAPEYSGEVLATLTWPVM